MSKRLIYAEDAIDALRYAQHRFTVADEAGGTGTVKWSEYVIYFATAERILTELPSVQSDLITEIQNGIKATDADDEYSCGMRNGMRWCKSLIDDKEPLYENCPPAQLEITHEQAIDYLQSTGWMQNHDREMYEQKQREQTGIVQTENERKNDKGGGSEEMKEYVKIETVYERDMNGTKKLVEGQFRDETVAFLRDCMWDWTEKIDGTNIGVVWDGHRVSYQGRTERAQIPSPLVNRLNELFGGETNEELFEQTFGEENVILFGEGYGQKIQKVGAQYLPDGVDFILFDVYLPDKDLWLKRDAVEDIATVFGLDVVPIIMSGDIGKAVGYVKTRPMSTIGTAPMEGLVGRPCVEVRDRQGKRVIVKVKARDFE